MPLMSAASSTRRSMNFLCCVGRSCFASSSCRNDSEPLPKELPTLCTLDWKVPGAEAAVHKDEITASNTQCATRGASFFWFPPRAAVGCVRDTPQVISFQHDRGIGYLDARHRVIIDVSDAKAAPETAGADRSSAFRVPEQSCCEDVALTGNSIG